MLFTDAHIIGIHNQDPLALYVQFAVGDHYYIYERNCVAKSESIQEEFFKEKSYDRRGVSGKDARILLGKIKFLPKIKKVIKDYPFNNS